MTKKFLTLSATALAATFALTGCSTGTGPGSTGASTTGTESGSSSAPASSSAAATAGHNAADVMFAQMMIPHHAQAVKMSDMMLAKQDIPAEVAALATKIKAAQGPEIETMTGWLTGWNEPTKAPTGHDMSTHGTGGMAGMMSDSDMKKLDAAQGNEAAKLFLTQMIGHHQGAVMMAKTETAGGKNPDAVSLSKAIVTAQEAEIQEMQALLAKL
ncbi:DUF305 domain-containing protein [Arthrobacter sp. FW305-BF8]|uniref:DUF305 domain-containing protein n=1 Tax=Arthrobacter sp. FW305-BF8 TaxID=2879617 RepID=UPI001F3A18D1|nr:DUF305 domain-containing protein [Arthrobacter sp. FW305-BF8]UKA53501.1 DUF305 domain-containing protein [Arthrobacter sp. FW305-BF8]